MAHTGRGAGPEPERAQPVLKTTFPHREPGWSQRATLGKGDGTVGSGDYQPQLQFSGDLLSPCCSSGALMAAQVTREPRPGLQGSLTAWFSFQRESLGRCECPLC